MPPQAEGAHSAHPARYGEEPHEMTAMVAKPEQVQANKPAHGQQQHHQRHHSSHQQQQQQPVPTTFFKYMLYKLDINSRLDQKASAIYGASRGQKLVTYCGFGLLFLVWGIVVALCVGSLYIWQRFVHVPCEQPLTNWLAVTGITGLAHLTLSNILACSGSRPNRLRQMWDFMMFLFAFCLGIWGAVMLYSIDRNNHICPREVFQYMWSMYILVWVSWGLLLLYACVVAIQFFRNNKK